MSHPSPIRVAHRFLALVAEDNKKTDLERSCGTALHRKGPSVPARWLHERELIRGPVLDFGAGHGEDVKWLRSQGFQVKAYDPCHGPEKFPKGKYNTVLSTYVLNTLPKKKEAGILAEIRKCVRSGGSAFITVRGKVETGQTSTGTYQRNVTLDLPLEGSPSGSRVYRMDVS